MSSESIDLAPGETSAAVAQCGAGQLAISGGWITGIPTSEVIAVNSFHSTSGTNDSWTVTFRNLSTTETYSVQSIAYCSPAPAGP